MFFVVLLRQPEFFAKRFLPAIGPLSLLALLFTIIVILCGAVFAARLIQSSAGQGDAVVRSIVNVLRVAAPLLVYFIVIFFVALFVCRRLGFGYRVTGACFVADRVFDGAARDTSTVLPDSTSRTELHRGFQQF